MKKSLYLTGLLAIAALVGGCSDSAKEEKAELRNTEALILNVERHVSDGPTHRTFIFLDTDGNPDTAEYMLQVGSLSSCSFLDAYNGAKVGNYTTIKDLNETFKDYPTQWVIAKKKTVPIDIQRQKD